MQRQAAFLCTFVCFPLRSSRKNSQRLNQQSLIAEIIKTKRIGDPSGQETTVLSDRGGKYNMWSRMVLIAFVSYVHGFQLRPSKIVNGPR